MTEITNQNLIKEISYKGEIYDLQNNSQFAKNGVISFLIKFFKRNFNKDIESYDEIIYFDEVKEFIDYCIRREISKQQIGKIIEIGLRDSRVNAIIRQERIAQENTEKEINLETVLDIIAMFNLPQEILAELKNSFTEIFKKKHDKKYLKILLRDEILDALLKSRKYFFTDWKYDPIEFLNNFKYSIPGFDFDNYIGKVINTEANEETEKNYGEDNGIWRVEFEVSSKKYKIEFPPYAPDELIDLLNQIISKDNDLEFVRINVDEGDSYNFILLPSNASLVQLGSIFDFF